MDRARASERFAAPVSGPPSREAPRTRLSEEVTVSGDHSSSRLDQPGVRSGSSREVLAEVGGVTAEEHLREFRVKQALKAALVCCLCILVPSALHIQSIYFGPVFAFMVLTTFYNDTLGAALEALLGVLTGASGALVITALFGSVAPIYLVFMLAWLFTSTLFLNRFPLGAMLGSIIPAILLFTSIFVSRATVFDLSVHLFGVLALALAITVAVDHLLWPPQRRTVFLDVLATIYESLGAGFAGLHQSRADDPSELRALLRLHELGRVVQTYQGSGSNKDNPLVRLLMNSSALLLHLEFQRREWQRMAPDAPDDTLALADRLLAGIGAQCRRIGQAALARAPAQPVDPGLVESAGTLIEVAPEPRPAPDAESPGQVRSWANSPALPMLARTIVRLGEATDAYNLSVALVSKPGFAVKAARAPLRIDPAALKRGTRTILILVLLILGQYWLDLPGQTMVAFYAITFGAAANLGQAYTRTAGGLAGILVGLLYGIVCIAVAVTLPNFAIFLGLIFLGTFCAGYLALCPGPIGVGALQAGLVVPFATLVYDGPEWTLASAETRALALLVAGLIAILVHRLVWPALPLRALRSAIAASLSQAGGMLSALFDQGGSTDRSESARRLLPLSEVVPRALSLSNDAKYLFSGMGGDSLRYHSVIRGLMSLDVHLSLLDGIIGRVDPLVRERFRVAVAPVIARLVEACATAGAQFGPAPSPDALAESADGSATAALAPLDAALRAQGPSTGEQRRYLSLLARSLDHLQVCLQEISSIAAEIGPPGRSAW
jgi:uncharacterized membrane protein YccC